MTDQEAIARAQKELNTSSYIAETGSTAGLRTMPNTRDKLIALVDGFTDPLSAREIHSADFAERFADHLIANGVTAQTAPKTNADRIRAMSDEELEKFINHFNICDLRTNDECKISYCACCEVCVMDWLQQPVKEEPR